MWWTGRHPGMTEDEDNLHRGQEKWMENLSPEVLIELLELLGENIHNSNANSNYIPSIDFARTPSEAHSQLVKPREIHVRTKDGVGNPYPYRGPAKTPFYRISNTDAAVVYVIPK
jgi:hypothetical protein